MVYVPSELKSQIYARKIKANLHSHFESKPMETISGKATTFANAFVSGRRGQGRSNSERRPNVRNRGSDIEYSPILRERESPSKTRAKTIANSSRAVRSTKAKQTVQRTSVTPPPNPDGAVLLWHNEELPFASKAGRMRAKSIQYSSRGVSGDDSLGVQGMKDSAWQRMGALLEEM